MALKLLGSVAAACTAMDAPQHQPTDANLLTPLALRAATIVSTSLLTTPCSRHSNQGSKGRYRLSVLGPSARCFELSVLVRMAPSAGLQPRICC